MTILLSTILVMACAGARQAPPGGPGTPEATMGWKLVWADEFDGPEGAPPDPARWAHDLGGGGWGNRELQLYTNLTTNAFQAGGMLHLVARKGGVEDVDCWYGPCEYTSARIKTKGRFEQKHGRFSARIRVPKGQGIWPAFWLLGADIDTARWPACGEIDVMEVIGREPATLCGTIHGPGYSGANGPQARWSLPAGELGDAFYVFAVEWQPERIRFSIDGHVYATRTPADIPPNQRWAFDHDFFMLLNVAVGGSWPGAPDATTRFPAEMLVDWIRVEVPE